MWSDYHRSQSRTLANLARLTSDSSTAASLLRLAAQHADLADLAESQGRDRAESEQSRVVSPFAKRTGRS
jgi:hypothetical protein